MKNTQISLKTAKKWAKTWREMESTYNKYHECKAFNIPLEDLNGVLSEPGVKSVRAYLAVETIDATKDQYEEKLLIVGVNADGKDMINVNRNLESDGSGIYDFTTPCPDFCDDDSPLNGGG